MQSQSRKSSNSRVPDSNAGKSEPTGGDSEITNGANDPEPEGDARGTSEKKLALAIERRYTDVLESVFFNSNPEIKKVKVDKDSLELSVYFPFLLPQPSPGGGKWMDTTAAQRKLRRDFAQYLHGKEFGIELANFFRAHFATFLLKLGNISKYRTSIQKHLRRLPQKSNAGRRRQAIDKAIARQIRCYGPQALEWLKDLQKTVESWIRVDPQLEDEGLSKKIFRRYPAKNYPWVTFFMKIAYQIPRKPYSVSTCDNTSTYGGELPPATLSEPTRWSTLDISAKVLQAKLAHDHGVQFPLRSIRDILRKSLR